MIILAMRMFVAGLGERLGRGWERLKSQEWLTFRSGCLAFFGAVVLLGKALPAEGQVGGFFGSFLESFSGGTEAWALILIGPAGAAVEVFYWCLWLQVGAIGLRLLIAVLTRKESNFWAVVLRQFPLLLFLYGALHLWPDYGGLYPVDFFEDIGQELTGYDEGINSEELIGGAYGLAKLYTSPKLVLYNAPLFPNPMSFLYPVMIVITVLAYGAIAVRTLFLTIEGNVLATTGPIFLALGGWSVTAGFADNYFRYAARFGVEFMFTMLMVSAGSNLGVSWAAELDGIPAVRQDLIFVFVGKIAVVTVVWAMVAIRLPSKLAAGLVHFWTPGIKEALGNG